MGNFSWLEKEGKKRLAFPKYELKKMILKSLIAASSFNWFDKFYFSQKFQLIPRNAACSFYRNACFTTALSRATFSLFKHSRHFSKAYASGGIICGLRKSSF